MWNRFDLILQRQAITATAPHHHRAMQDCTKHDGEVPVHSHSPLAKKTDSNPALFAFSSDLWSTSITCQHYKSVPGSQSNLCEVGVCFSGAVHLPRWTLMYYFNKSTFHPLLWAMLSIMKSFKKLWGKTQHRYKVSFTPVINWLMLMPGGEHEGEETLVAVIMKGQSTWFPGRDSRERAE